MSMLVIGDVCSRLRGLIKANRQDAFITDRYLYSLFRKHASLSIKRLDEKGRLMAFSSFRKTTLPIPVFTEGKWGPMVRSITSLDGSTPFQLTSLDNYVILSNQKNFKYNKTKYCWYLNDRIYFPDVDYPAIRIEGMFEEDISIFKCNYDDKCKPRQQQSLNVPDHLLSEIEANVLKDLGFSQHIPSDQEHDNININR